jgi:hypothetical protein
MLRRFAPFMVLALIVLAFIGAFVIRSITANRGPCAELFGMLLYPQYPAKNRCDFFVQLADNRQAYSRRIEDARNRCGLPAAPDYLDWLNYVEAVQTRIEACDPVTVGRHREVPAQVVLKLVSNSSDRVSNSSDRGFCSELLASALHYAPPDRGWNAFEARHTKKNYCDFLVEFFNSEQVVIDRFDNAKAECTVALPGWFEPKHAKTLERRKKACDAAAVDPDGLVSSYNR